MRPRSDVVVAATSGAMWLAAATSGVMLPDDVHGEVTEAAEQRGSGHHRLDLSYSRVDLREGDADLLVPGYTLTVANSFRMGIAIGYYDIDPDDVFAGPETENLSGWGDTQLVLQWDPGERITSNPWVPDRLGAYSIITAPTSTAEFATEQWEVEIGFGAPAWETKHFALLPSGYFRSTFKERDQENRDREVGLIPAVYWVVNEQFWVGYEPAIAYNSTLNDWAYDHSLTAGWLFRAGLGIGFSITRLDRIDPGATSDGYTGLLDFYLVFGKPR